MGRKGEHTIIMRVPDRNVDREEVIEDDDDRLKHVSSLNINRVNNINLFGNTR